MINNLSGNTGRLSLTGGDMKIKIETDCGTQTCAESRGKSCAFLQSTMLGIVPYCGLFNVALGDVDGWVMRCQACVEKFKDE